MLEQITKNITNLESNNFVQRSLKHTNIILGITVNICYTVDVISRKIRVRLAS